MAALEARGLTFSYGEVPVLSGIDFTLGPGSILCVAGPNGCGKTTLLDCVMGHAKPRSGEVLVGGTSVARLDARRLALRMAYVPQVHERAFPYTALDIVLMGRTAHAGAFSSPSAEDEDRAAAALARVGLRGFEGRPYTKLSGGECQLVMLARALAQETGIIVMDEPTAHLDLRNELVFLETAASLARERGVSVLMATHDPSHALHFENAGIDARVGLLRDGVFAFEGRPSATLTEENVRAAYGVLSRIVCVPGEAESPTRHLVALGVCGKDGTR